MIKKKLQKQHQSIQFETSAYFKESKLTRKPFLSLIPAQETKARLLRKYDKEEKYHSKKTKNKYLVSLKCKPIDWNTSATTWTRNQSPSHQIPKAKRQCCEPSKAEQKYISIDPEEYDLRERLNERGVTFARSMRKQLFLRDPTPSPAQYEHPRYLSPSISPNSRRSVSPPCLEHLKGGTINRTTHYQDFYPHPNKVRFDNFGSRRKERIFN